MFLHRRPAILESGYSILSMFVFSIVEQDDVENSNSVLLCNFSCL